MIFRPENLMVDFVGEEKAVALLDAPVEAFKAALYMENVEKNITFRKPPGKRRFLNLRSGQLRMPCR